MSDSADVTIKQGEAKPLRFTITSGGVEVDVSSATLSFAMKADKRHSETLVEKEDADFNKVQAASGIVTVPLSATDTDQPKGDYYGELKTVFAADNIDKSVDIVIKIERAIT